MNDLLEKGRASIQSQTKTKPKPNWVQSESKLRPKTLQNQILTTQAKHMKHVSMLIMTQFRSKPRPNWILIEAKADPKPHQIESKPVPLLYLVPDRWAITDQASHL